jgi:hypothetical protein
MICEGCGRIYFKVLERYLPRGSEENSEGLSKTANITAVISNAHSVLSILLSIDVLEITGQIRFPTMQTNH